MDQIQTEYFQVGQKLLAQGQLTVISRIGQGSFATVYLCKYRKDKIEMDVAVKAYNKSRYKRRSAEYDLFIQEVQILKKLESRHICKYLELDQDANYYYLITEYCDDGNLSQKRQSIGTKIYLKKRKSEYLTTVLDEYTALRYTKQILIAFHDMNWIDPEGKVQHVLHRDLKAENIFLKKDGDESIIKVGDFGFAKQLTENQLTTTMLGSAFTMAPEVSTFKGYDHRCDIYSLGVVLYQLLFGCYPFHPPNLDRISNDDKILIPKKIAEFAQKNQPNFNKYGVKISEDVQKLLTQMLQIDANKRISFEQLYKHPLFNAEVTGFELIPDHNRSKLPENKSNRPENRSNSLQNQSEDFKEEEKEIMLDPNLNLQVLGDIDSGRSTLKGILLHNRPFITLDTEILKSGSSKIQISRRNLYVHHEKLLLDQLIQQSLRQADCIVLVQALHSKKIENQSQEILKNIQNWTEAIKDYSQDKCVIVIANKRKEDSVLYETIIGIQEYCMKNNQSFLAVDLVKNPLRVREFILSQIRLHIQGDPYPQTHNANITLIHQKNLVKKSWWRCF